jgi:hypothetical protein
LVALEAGAAGMLVASEARARLRSVVSFMVRLVGCDVVTSVVGGSMRL